MDKIIDYINANPAKYGIRVQYGTLSEFFNNALETTLPDGTASTIDLPDATNIPDFLPIATCWGRDIQDYNGECTSYWSGFFTSYPALKRASRSNTEFLQVRIDNSSPYSKIYHLCTSGQAFAIFRSLFSQSPNSNLFSPSRLLSRYIRRGDASTKI